MSSQLLDAAQRSLALSLVVATASGALGLALAWLVTRARFPGSSRLAGLLAIPYALPAYLLGMAWIVLGNPSVGLLKGLIPGSSGIYGFWGMAFVETSVAFAFPYLELKAGFERMDPALEEAARMSGASPWGVFRDVSLPLLLPSLSNGMALSFLYTLSSFGVPALLGLPVKQFVLTTLIYSELKIGGAAGFSRGLSLSLLLLAIAALVLAASFLLSRRSRARTGAILGSKSSRLSRVALPPAAAWAAALGGWGFFALAVLLPWSALALSALSQVAGEFSPARFSLRNFRYVLSLPDFQEALVNSLGLALGVAALVALTGFLLAFYRVRRGSRLAALLIESLGLPFATPGTVLALLVIFVSVRVAGSIDAPLLWIAVAYALKYGAVTARLLVPAFSQVHPALEEAAQVSGARTPTLLRTIWLPLLARSLAAGFFLSALPMLTELTMSVLLTGPGAATLGTVLFQLQEYADQPSAAALAWLLLSAALGTSFLLQARAPRAEGPLHE